MLGCSFLSHSDVHVQIDLAKLKAKTGEEKRKAKKGGATFYHESTKTEVGN